VEVGKDSNILVISSIMEANSDTHQYEVIELAFRALAYSFRVSQALAYSFQASQALAYSFRASQAFVHSFHAFLALAYSLRASQA
jgi:hypothetical protein